MTHKEIINKIGKESEEKLINLCKLAKESNLQVKVRAKKNEFTIFIYDKGIKSSYMVGFDGCFNGDTFTFDHCIKQSEGWIKEYQSI